MVKINNPYAVLFDLCKKLKDCGVEVKISGEYKYSEDFTSLDFVEEVSSIDFSEHDNKVVKEFTQKTKNKPITKEKYCGNCVWYAEVEGVCCNGDSEYRADFLCPDDSCQCWEGKPCGKKI